MEVLVTQVSGFMCVGRYHNLSNSIMPTILNSHALSSTSPPELNELRKALCGAMTGTLCNNGAFVIDVSNCRHCLIENQRQRHRKLTTREAVRVTGLRLLLTDGGG